MSDSEEKNYPSYEIKGMNSLYMDYNGRRPHIALPNGRIDIWVIDDHNLVVRSRLKTDRGEEWCELYKEHDCWWLKRMGHDVSRNELYTILSTEEMNCIDNALFDYFAEKEFLNV